MSLRQNPITAAHEKNYNIISFAPLPNYDKFITERREKMQSLRLPRLNK